MDVSEAQRLKAMEDENRRLKLLVAGLHYTPPGREVESTVDIIPFGQLATQEQKIEWPPGADMVMNVAAFSDVFASSVEIQINANLSIPVASLPGLVILSCSRGLIGATTGM